VIILNSLFPVFALILLGSALNRYGLTNEIFLKTSDRLIYFIFFPAMLFWKIGGATTTGIQWRYCVAALLAVLAMFLVSLICIRLLRVSDYQAGTFSQSCYRFNTYIGMAIVLTALGEEGATQFGILIGFVIPFINVLAVSTLIWFSGKRIGLKERIAMTARSIVTNPLILGCLAGLLYARIVNRFPTFLDNTLRLTTMVTLPLALISIGGALTFTSLRSGMKLALTASAVKLLLFPAVGYLLFRLLGVDGVAFKTGMIFFALPAATSIYILSAQLNSDTELASATIVLSTILSFFSLSAALLL
jgi:hypothetical protein